MNKNFDYLGNTFQIQLLNQIVVDKLKLYVLPFSKVKIGLNPLTCIPVGPKKEKALPLGPITLTEKSKLS